MPTLNSKQPNILLIVADDLGWSDIGAFGGEINTPHLDEIVSKGVRMTNFHASPVCSTTRAMLMTGCDHHEVGLGNLAELMTPLQRNKPGYEGYLNERASTLPELLRDGGYLTLMSGKWHLGIEGESPPASRGFERSFALMQGEHNHFGLDQTPETSGFLGTSSYMLDGSKTSYPEGSYSSDVFADYLCNFMEEAKDDERPIFSYLAFTAPHCPLQAPKALTEKYKGRYDDGPIALRQRRQARMRELELHAGEASPAVMLDVALWEELDEMKKRKEARKMEVYAAMVEAMDAAIGRVMDTLADTGRADNCIVVFISDNGPSGVLRETLPGWEDWIASHANNNIDNIGNPNSYVSIGPSWAQAQAAPYFLFKRFTTEGGIRTCAIAAGPEIKQRAECREFIHVMDLVPTLLELPKLMQRPPRGSCRCGENQPQNHCAETKTADLFPGNQSGGSSAMAERSSKMVGRLSICPLRQELFRMTFQ